MKKNQVNKAENKHRRMAFFVIGVLSAFCAAVTALCLKRFDQIVQPKTPSRPKSERFTLINVCGRLHSISIEFNKNIARADTATEFEELNIALIGVTTATGHALRLYKRARGMLTTENRTELDRFAAAAKAAYGDTDKEAAAARAFFDLFEQKIQMELASQNQSFLSVSR